MNQSEYDKGLIKEVSDCVYDPLGYVKMAYKWGEGDLTGDGCERPRDWQRDILQEIGTHLQSSETRYVPLNIAVASGHGIGKSALIAQVTMWGLSTCDNTRVVVTANTDGQLRTKTWPEVLKWSKMAINSNWFERTATSLYSSNKSREKEWRADAIPWSMQNPESFAGLHNKKKRIILIFDEASAIHDTIWEVAEGAMTDTQTEIIFIAFGNPTRCEGRFKECFGKYRHRWITKQIDSRDVEGTNKEKFQQWIDDYGIDSDFVKVRVRGLFPSASPDKLISQEQYDACVKYNAVEYEWFAKVMGVDVARFGTNKNAVCLRQGRKVYPFVSWFGLDAMQSASRIVEQYQIHNPDAVFIDEGGLGGPIIDRVRQLIPKEKVFGVQFGSKASKPTRFYNKRAEMWWTLKEAIEEKVDITSDQELNDDLLVVPYMFDGKNRIQLPKKEDMEFSPDKGDALALTYAQPVIRNKPAKKRGPPQKRSWRG